VSDWFAHGLLIPLSIAQEADMSKKKSGGGKSNGGFGKGSAKPQFGKTAPVSKRPPRHQGR
jgi:hypothetical protein